MKNIILINGYRTACSVLPAGIGYIAQAIENAGFDYDVCDVNIQTADQIVQVIKGIKPKYVGLGTMTYEVEKNYQLIGLIRDSVPNVIIILGGPHAIAAQKEIFQECSAIDIVIQGEGEESLVKLLQGVSLHDIRGTLTRDSQDVAIPREFLNINNIAFPQYHKFDLAKYGDTMQIASSRGCVYQCLFCGAPKFLGNKWRSFKVSRMIEEFEYWYNRGYRQFYFSDSLFVLNKKRVIEFCTYIIESGYDDVVFTADGVRADHLTLEVLQNMKRANFRSLTIGVESVNDKTLTFFKKKESFSQIDNAISIADSLGFDITIYLIIGAPEEVYNDVIKSIQYPMKYKNIVNAIFSKLMPIMGTPYYDYAIEHKLLFDESVYYPKIEAYGANERQDSHNSVEEIWNDLYPAIEKMSNFLAIRNCIKKGFSFIGFYNIDVKRLNILTQISLNLEKFVFGRLWIRILKETYFKSTKVIAKLFFILKKKYYSYFYFRNGLLQADKIFTHLTLQEKRKLFELAQSIKNGYGMEIGSFVGASSCFIAAGLNKDSKLICIDTWENDAMSEGMRGTFKEFCENTEKYNNKIIRIKGFSHEAVEGVKKITNKVDFLFIDGDHSYDGCKKDWDLYSSMVKKGGVVVFHDCGWADGVIKVINDDVKPLMSKYDQFPNMFWGWIK
jgi:radical SAM superfamily enzyme YgiQ (UPF0313 family)/predicted O-methyltransferase YrrM